MLKNTNASTEEKAAVLSVKRNQRDRVFRMLYKDKERFLELYNAMNGTSYENADDLQVITLENAVYISMKNDVSYLVYTQLPIYEHQSTINLNIPLRDLFYVSKQLSVLTRNENLYGRKMIKIPEPKFVVFYNGVEPMEESVVLKLSDMYEQAAGEPELELKVQVLNINEGFNEELKSHCQTLKEYMIYVNKIREYQGKMPFAEAVNRAVDECIREGALADFLSRNKSEVVAMSIFEYDEEKHMRLERRDAKAEGKAESVIEFLEELDTVPEKLKNRIMEENDLTLLSDWLKKAARAESIEGFIEKTNINL